MSSETPKSVQSCPTDKHQKNSRRAVNKPAPPSSEFLRRSLLWRRRVVRFAEGHVGIIFVPPTIVTCSSNDSDASTSHRYWYDIQQRWAERVSGGGNFEESGGPGISRDHLTTPARERARVIVRARARRRRIQLFLTPCCLLSNDRCRAPVSTVCLLVLEDLRRCEPHEGGGGSGRFLPHLLPHSSLLALPRSCARACARDTHGSAHSPPRLPSCGMLCRVRRFRVPQSLGPGARGSNGGSRSSRFAFPRST